MLAKLSYVYTYLRWIDPLYVLGEMSFVGK